MFKTKTFPKYVQEVVYTKIKAIGEPNRFAIRGTPGGATATHISAYAALEKLQKWVEKEGAELTIIQDEFHNLPYNVRPSRARIIIEITDPCSEVIENYIKETRGGDLYALPKDPSTWRDLQERIAKVKDPEFVTHLQKRFKITAEEYIKKGL